MYESFDTSSIKRNSPHAPCMQRIYKCTYTTKDTSNSNQHIRRHTPPYYSRIKEVTPYTIHTCEECEKTAPNQRSRPTKGGNLPKKMVKIKVKFQQILFCKNNSPCMIDYQGDKIFGVLHCCI